MAFEAPKWSEIRQRFATAIETIDAEWTEAENPALGLTRAPSSNAHKTFSVSITGNTARSLKRQRQPEGIEGDTSVNVQFNFCLAPPSQVASYDAAMDEAEKIINQIINKYTELYSGIEDISYVGATFNPVSSGEWVVPVITFKVYHFKQLQ